MGLPQPAYPAYPASSAHPAHPNPLPPPRPVPVQVLLAAGREDAAGPIAQALQSIAPFVAEATVRRQDEIFRAVVDRIVEATPIRPLDAARAALEQRAIAAIFSGTEWLTAEQLGRLRDPAARNPHSIAARWREQGKLFAISRAGVLYHPRYALDEAWEPRPVVAELMQALAAAEGGRPWSAYRLAGWFESTHGHLGGRRPRECLAREPEAVRAAAHAEAERGRHG